MKRRLYGKRLVLGVGLSAVLAFSPLVFAEEHGGGGEAHAGGEAHGGGGHGAPAAAKAMSVTEAMKVIIQGNDKFRKEHDSNYFEPYQKGQTPNITVLSCADSRVHTPLFGMDPNNAIFMVRDIGNQIRNAEGSVDYGVEHLPTKVLLILGHSSCGAIKAAMGDYSKESAGIRNELDNLKPVVAADTSEEEFDRRWAKNIEINVDYQVHYALQLYKAKVAAGELAVVGGVYDFNDLYGKGRGTLVITNVNGDTDPNRLIDNPVFKDLAAAEVVNHVGSLAPAVTFSEQPAQ